MPKAQKPAPHDHSLQPAAPLLLGTAPGKPKYDFTGVLAVLEDDSNDEEDMVSKEEREVARAFASRYRELETKLRSEMAANTKLNAQLQDFGKKFEDLNKRAQQAAQSAGVSLNKESSLQPGAPLLMNDRSAPPTKAALFVAENRETAHRVAAILISRKEGISLADAQALIIRRLHARANEENRSRFLPIARAYAQNLIDTQPAPWQEILKATERYLHTFLTELDAKPIAEDACRGLVPSAPRTLEDELDAIRNGGA